MVTCTSACNHPTRNNESTDLLVLSRARLHAPFKFQSDQQHRSIYAVTIRPKSLYEDTHASTGHPEYSGMQWHQKNTIGANYTDKDAAAPMGICQGCALGSAHQYPTNQHYVMTDKPHDPGQQLVVDAFTHHSVGHSGYICSLVHRPCISSSIPCVHEVQISIRVNNQYVRTLLCTS